MKASDKTLQLAEDMIKNTDNIKALIDDYKYNRFSVERFALDLIYHHAKWGEFAEKFTRQSFREGLRDCHRVTVIKKALANCDMTY